MEAASQHRSFLFIRILLLLPLSFPSSFCTDALFSFRSAYELCILVRRPRPCPIPNNQGIQRLWHTRYWSMNQRKGHYSSFLCFLVVNSCPCKSNSTERAILFYESPFNRIFFQTKTSNAVQIILFFLRLPLLHSHYFHALRFLRC